MNIDAIVRFIVLDVLVYIALNQSGTRTSSAHSFGSTTGTLPLASPAPPPVRRTFRKRSKGQSDSRCGVGNGVKPRYQAGHWPKRTLRVRKVGQSVTLSGHWEKNPTDNVPTPTDRTRQYKDQQSEKGARTDGMQYTYLDCSEPHFGDPMNPIQPIFDRKFHSKNHRAASV